MTASNRFLGGSPLAVAFRLILLSVLVGVVLAAIGFDPWNILHSIRMLFQRLWDLGFDAVNWLWRYFLLGAVIVIPIWLLSRLFGTQALTPRAGSPSLAPSLESHDGTGVCHRGSRDGREPDDAADRHRLDHGDRPARRRHAARRRGGRLGAVRLPVLAVRVPAHEHGRVHRAVARRRRDAGIARHPGARLHRRGAGRRRAHPAADPARQHPARGDGRQRGRHARRQNLLHDPDLVGAAGARQLCRAGLADRTGPRQAGARHADHHQPDQCGSDRAAGAGARLRHCRRGDRRRDRGSGRAPARHS